MTGVTLTFEQRRKKNARTRQYRLDNLQKVKVSSRASSKKWRQTHPGYSASRKKQQAEYYKQHKDRYKTPEAKARAAAYYQANKVHINQMCLTYQARIQERGYGYRVSKKAVAARTARLVGIYEAACTVVSTRLPQDIREDVISQLVLGVMEGTFGIEELAKRAKGFSTKETQRFYSKSLDSYVPGTTIKVIDTIVGFEPRYD